MAISYRQGSLSEVFVEGIIARSKYLQSVKSPWTTPQLLKLAQKSNWLSDNAYKYTTSRRFTDMPGDALDAIYGVDFLVQVEGELIAIDLTTNDDKIREKRDRLRESAKLLPTIDKWVVIYWDAQFPLSEQDLLEIYLCEEKFQLVMLMEMSGD